jgi:hypothetical protein
MKSLRSLNQISQLCTSVIIIIIISRIILLLHYILSAIQLAAVIARLSWYLGLSLIPNHFDVFPWAIVCQVADKCDNIYLL